MSIRGRLQGKFSGREYSFRHEMPSIYTRYHLGVKFVKFHYGGRNPALRPIPRMAIFNQHIAASIKALEYINSLFHIVVMLTSLFQKAYDHAQIQHQVVSACLHVKCTPDTTSYGSQGNRHEIRPATRFHFGLLMQHYESFQWTPK